MQTITTTYKGPTNTKGSRVLAKSWLKNKSVAWDHALNTEDNHRAAAQALVEELNDAREKKGHDDCQWSIVAAGSLPDGRGNAYIIDLQEA